MRRSSVGLRSFRRLLVVVGIASLGALAAATDACVLVEPAAELPRIPSSRPSILRGSVYPSASAVLTTFPTQLIVPVELADPVLPFYYAAFVDYNTATGEGLVVRSTESPFVIGNTVGRIRTARVTLLPPADLDRCHVIEVVVALAVESGTSGAATHTPREPGGDLVTWFYNPNGDLGGCPTLDAGFDAPLVDAGADGATEGGVQ